MKDRHRRIALSYSRKAYEQELESTFLKLAQEEAQYKLRFEIEYD